MNNKPTDLEAPTRLLPQTTYKDKRVPTDAERFKLNRELNDYLFENCDHAHEGYPNYLACRPCVLECFAAIAARVDPPAEPTLHWPFVAKHANCAECTREYEPVPTTPDERDKALARQVIARHSSKAFLSFLGHVPRQELELLFTAALAQVRSEAARETWKDAITELCLDCAEDDTPTLDTQARWYYHGEGREQVGCSASKLRLRQLALESASKQER